MKKKVVAILLSLTCVLSFAGCAQEVDSVGVSQNYSRFRLVNSYYLQTHGVSLSPAFLYVDRLTGVLYLYKADTSFTVLVDAEGKPLLYEGDLDD